MMDKRTKEYKEWAAAQAAERKRKWAERQAAKAMASQAVAAQGDPVPPVLDGPKPDPTLPPPLTAEEVDATVETIFTQPLARPQEDVVVDLKPKATAPVRAETRKPTRPWERKSAARPWRRDYFNLERKRPGFRCRFVDPANVESRIQRGYQVANPNDYGGLVDIDIRDTTGLGKYLSRHGMVLMEIPEEGAQAYEQQNEELIQARQRSTKEELEKEGRSVGVKVTDRETVSK